MIETDHSVVVFPIASWPGNDLAMIAKMITTIGDQQLATGALIDLCRNHEANLLRRGVPLAAIRIALGRYVKDVRDCEHQIQHQNGA